MSFQTNFQLQQSANLSWKRPLAIYVSTYFMLEVN